ncbi:putative nucleotide-binding protein, TIR-like protein [Gottschalkia acidurici 9a]|uniref:Nucleotide-binding protein, TIR-like protein n=2 Tax=Clostridium acidurici TaxID=1556 RepID=K0AW63_GOTA9|nr:putative nucleotide-binding protein, TIR-like protein [Gottschalkia acidurici 9a]
MDKDENTSVTFFYELSKLNILRTKIKIDCLQCMEEICIIYDKTKEEIECPECGFYCNINDVRWKDIIYSLNIYENKSTMNVKNIRAKKVNPLDFIRQDSKNGNQEKTLIVDALKNDKKTKIVNISERKRGKKMKIFLGSSKEAEEVMDEIAVIIESYKHDALPWNQPGTFIAGNYLYDSLIDISKSVDAAIFIFNEDDEVWYRGDMLNQARDNVLIEYGLFTGALDRSKVIFCTKGNPKIASDLKGITYINMEMKHTAKLEIKAWLEKISCR